MKVRCEYCQNMVETGGDKICPYCGSPLPAASEQPRPRAAARPSRWPAVVVLLAAVLVAAVFFLLSKSDGEKEKGGLPGLSVLDAMDAVSSGAAGSEAYQVVIAYYLEDGRIDAAYQAAWDLLEGPDGGMGMDWCFQRFSAVGRRDLAARLAMAGYALSGGEALYAQAADIPLSELLPESPLYQAIELALGRTAGTITLADLQAVRGLSIGRRDTLSGAQEIGVIFDGVGREPVYVTVDAAEGKSGLGTICFQGLRSLTIDDPNVRTQEDLFLPNLEELSIPLRMDAENLLKFTHLKKLEHLQIGGPSLVSLDGLDQLPALTELALFDTGLTDLSVLASCSQLTGLELLSNDQLTSVASLSKASHLKRLALSGKNLADLSPLSSLSGLESLSVTGTGIRDAAFLAGMTGLKSLTLTENKELEAVPELSVLTGLERLEVDSDEVFADRQALEGLSHLKALKLRASRKLSFLQPLESLEELTVYSYQAVWDVSELSALKELKRLSFSSGSDFYDSYTVSLEGLDGLRSLSLELLDLGGKTVYGPIDTVLDIPTLEVLNLSGVSSRGTDYSKFVNLTKLRELDLGGYRDMQDVPPGPDEEYWSYEAGPAEAFIGQLGSLSSLERLSLSGCGAENIDSLAGLTGLKYLDLSDNNLSDISPLTELRELRYLNLSGNRIGDCSPVEGRPNLTLVR